MKGCLAWLAGVVVIGGGLIWLAMRQLSLGPEDTWVPAAVASGAASLGLAFVAGIRRPRRENAALRRCMQGAPPIDGRHTAVYGKIETAGEPLRAPLSGTSCAAYEYEIYRRTPGSKTSHHVMYFKGLALGPARIHTPAGSIRFLSMPELDFPRDPLDTGTALRNAEEHVRRTQFQPRGSPIVILAEQPTDDSGAYRREERGDQAEGDTFDRTCFFEERHVKEGETVCAVGTFSAERFALAPEPGWSQPTRIMTGDLATLQRRLRRRILNYLLWAVFFFAIAAGTVAGFLKGLF